MNPRMWINVVAVALFSVAAVLIGGVVLSSGLMQAESPDEKARRERIAEAEAISALPTVARSVTMPGRADASEAGRVQVAKPTEIGRINGLNPFPGVDDPEEVKRIEAAEFAKTDKLDPQRLTRRNAGAKAGHAAIQAFLAFRADPVKEKADALEAAVEALRKLPSDFRDPDKPLADFYNPLNGPLTVRPHPENKDEWIGARIAQPTRAHWDEFFQFLATWRELCPESATPLIIRANAAICYAWEARGGGYVDTVTDESWELYRDRIQDALTALEQAEQTGNVDPQFYRIRIVAAKASDGDRELVLDCIEKGRKLQPDYWGLYEAAADFFLPRWHGAPGEVEQFANRLYDDLGGETGKLAFFRIAFSVHYADPHTVIEGEYDPAKLQAAGNAMMVHHPLIFEYTRFALAIGWVTEDFALSQRCRELLNGQLIIDKRILASNWVFRGVNSVWGLSPPKNAIPADVKRWQRATVADLNFFADGLIGTSALQGATLQFFRGTEFVPGGQKRLDGAACATLLPHADGKRLFHDLIDDNTTHAVSFPRERGAETILFDAVRSTRVQWAWSPDEKTLVGAGEDSKTHFWNATSGVKERSFSLFCRPDRIFFTADGSQLVVRNSHELLLIDVERGRPVWETEKNPDFPLHAYEIAGPLPDGRVLVYGENFRTKGKPGWHSWVPGESTVERICDADQPLRTALSADRRLFLWQEGRTRTTVVYDLEAGREVRRFPHVTSPTALAVAPDNGWLAVGFFDGSIRLWKLPSAN